MNGAFCEICKEWIRCPRPRQEGPFRGRIVCTECADEDVNHSTIGGGSTLGDRAVHHDIRYHGEGAEQ